MNQPFRKIARWCPYVRTPVLVSIALVALATLVYAPLAHFGFVTYDDGEYVSSNPMVKAGLSRAGVVWAFTTGHAANWHPLTWLSLMLDAQIFGAGAAAGFHVTNLIFHAINTLLLFWLLRRLTGALWRSAFVAAIFAIHPIHVESVAWISERKDVLSGFFALLTLFAYARYAHRPSVARYLPVVGLFALGLMAKPMLVTLPCVLLLLDFWPLRRADLTWAKWPRLVLEKVPMLLLSAASSAVTFVVQRQWGATAEFEVLPFALRMKNAIVSCVGYISKMLWPAGLAVDYPYAMTIPMWRVAICALLLVSVSIAFVRWMSSRPYLVVGWAWFLGMLVPVIGLVQVGGQPMADRYTYLPSIGFSIAVVWAVGDLSVRVPRRRIALSLAAAAILLACVVTARLQVATWENGLTLWQHAVRVGPENGKAHGNLGATLAIDGRVDEAIDHYREAIRLEPDLAEAQNNLALALQQKGFVTEAIVHFTEAIRINPEYANAHGNLAMALVDSGRVRDGMRQLDTALELDPRRPEWYFAKGILLSDADRVTEAIALFEHALEVDPDYDLAKRALAEIRRDRP